VTFKKQEAGELFEGKPLRELLMEAVLYGDDPKHKQRLFTAVDGAVDQQKIWRCFSSWRSWRR
jgi:hypothetical protein